MKMHLKLVLSSFTRQENPNDCGAACLKTIINYCGIQAKLPATIKDEPLSLFQLQQLAAHAGLASRAVRMEAAHLRSADGPCILHILTDALTPHFIVCFAYDSELDLYLIGDPDGQVCYLPERELMDRWQSQAALFFGQLPRNKGWRPRLYPWINLSHFKFVPGILWIAVPFLNAFGTLLGLGATLVIEKAVSPKFLGGEFSAMMMIFALLFSLSLAKCIINYIKERLIINFAGRLDSSLYLEFVQPLERTFFNTRLLTRRFSETIKDIQRIHQSASVLVGGILCDGLMMLLMLICLYFYFPALILPEACVVTLLLFLTDGQLPFMLVNYQSVQASIIPSFEATNLSEVTDRERIIKYGLEANAAYSRKSQRLSANANKLNFYFDCIASVNIVLVLAYTIDQLRIEASSYQEFIFGIVLCYAIVGTANKICNQLFLVAHGAEMLYQRAKKG